ncbi:MAG: hypothetical protein D084_Lepto4C00398G0002 [Leptospirillum sp. Group IV 'UBA BS']|nr:MAG: hypothetical protein D084_Lepto4C00398G0002 [Leptospirillum sp. Group IV 'UBA BS']
MLAPVDEALRQGLDQIPCSGKVLVVSGPLSGEGDMHGMGKWSLQWEGIPRRRLRPGERSPVRSRLTRRRGGGGRPFRAAILGTDGRRRPGRGGGTGRGWRESRRTGIRPGRRAGSESGGFRERSGGHGRSPGRRNSGPPPRESGSSLKSRGRSRRGSFPRGPDGCRPRRGRRRDRGGGLP